MLISEILSYGIFFEFWTLNNGSPSDPTPFMNHLQYSLFLAFTSLLLLTKVFFENKIPYKILYFIFFLITTSNLFLNGGRTGQVVFIISIFIVGFLSIKNKVLAFGTMLLLLLSILFTAYQASPIFKHRFNASINESISIINNDNYCGSFGLRLGSWIVAYNIFKDNPVVGVGIGDAMPKLEEYLKLEQHNNKKCVNYMVKYNYHNFYVQVAVQLGIIGLFLYLMIFYSIITLNTKDKIYFNLIIIFVSTYSISSMFETMFHAQFSEALFILFIGLFISQNRIENET
jgi:O-antigen ligase